MRLYYTLCRKSPLKEDNLSTSTKDKMAGPEGVLIKIWMHLYEGILDSNPDLTPRLLKETGINLYRRKYCITLESNIN